MAPVSPIFHTHPDDFTDSKEKTLVRSASKEFVKKLTEIACQHNKCTNDSKKTTFSAGNLPVIAYCGHYICSSHKNAPVKTRDHFNTCYHCGEYCGEQVEEYLNDAVLNDFYKAIAQEGFKCLGCKERHPKHNTIFCHERIPNDGDTQYLCVWCFEKEEYANVKFMSLDSAKAQGDIDKDEQLKSVDRTQNLAGWALNRCCICRETLYTPSLEGKEYMTGEVWERSPIVHLACEHIGHKKCAQTKWPTTHFECKLCRPHKKYNKNDTTIRERSVPTKYYFKGAMPNDSDFFTCEECAQRHPNSNRLKKRAMCVWCNVERAHQERAE